MKPIIAVNPGDNSEQAQNLKAVLSKLIAAHVIPVSEDTHTVMNGEAGYGTMTVNVVNEFQKAKGFALSNALINKKSNQFNKYSTLKTAFYETNYCSCNPRR